tara:strand:+ start:918 stop:1676 length:759 start_codon:yes stop_codon:yes gene_type:complete
MKNNTNNQAAEQVSTGSNYRVLAVGLPLILPCLLGILRIGGRMTPHNTDPDYLRKEAKRVREREYYKKNKSSRLARQAVYRQENKEAIRIYRKEYDHKNKDAIKARKIAHRRANPEKHRIRAEAYYLRNKEKINAKHKEYRDKNKESIREYMANRHKQYPDEARAKKCNRRAREAGADGANYTQPIHIRGRWGVFGNKCWMCGKTATCTDHVKPLHKGGANWPSNLRPSCRPCNLSKGSKWPYSTTTQRETA